MSDGRFQILSAVVVSRLLTTIHQVHPHPISHWTKDNPDCVQSFCFITSICTMRPQTCVYLSFRFSGCHASRSHFFYLVLKGSLTNERHPIVCILCFRVCIPGRCTLHVSPLPSGFLICVHVLPPHSLYFLSCICTPTIAASSVHPMLFYALLSYSSWPDSISGGASTASSTFLNSEEPSFATTTSPHITVSYWAASRRCGILNQKRYIPAPLNLAQSLFLHSLST